MGTLRLLGGGFRRVGLRGHCQITLPETHSMPRDNRYSVVTSFTGVGGYSGVRCYFEVRCFPTFQGYSGVKSLPKVRGYSVVKPLLGVRGYSGVNDPPRVRDYLGVKGLLRVRCYSGVNGLPGVRGHSGSPPLQPPKDVVLFQHHRPRFFRLLGLFCLGQGGFWAYLGHYGFSSLRDTEAGKGGRTRGQGDSAQVSSLGGAGGSTAGPRDTSPGGKKLNLGSRLWRYGFTLTCFTVGSLILAAGFLFSRRSVSHVLLHRGGQQVTFRTSFPFGAGSSFTVPLRHVSCMAHRSEVPSMIPLKIKGHPLYFLLDKQGQVFNAKLFDVTVGAYRKL